MWRKLALIIIVLCISSCAPMHKMVTPELRNQFMGDLKSGRLGLTCQFDCYWSWLNEYPRMVQLHRASQWEALAELVMQVGLEQDLAYFFLGRAAEGLGHYDSAVKFYQQSIALYKDPVTLHHCEDGSGSWCAGLDLGAALPEVLAAAEVARNQQSAQAELLNKPFGYLAKLDGKDPVKENLWSDPKVMVNLNQTLGKQRTKQLITGWGGGSPVVTPMTRVDANMVFGACKPHDQCYHQAIVFISLTDGSVQACWQDVNTGRTVADVWLSPGGASRKLPGGYCEQNEDTDLSMMYRQNSRK
jgi:hypothetical protein